MIIETPINHTTVYRKFVKESKMNQGKEDTMGDATYAPTGVYPNGGYHNYGFEPSDAALVQGNHLAVHQSQLAFHIQQLNECIARNSKENVIHTLKLEERFSKIENMILQQSADTKATLQAMEIQRLNNLILELKFPKTTP